MYDYRKIQESDLDAFSSEFSDFKSNMLDFSKKFQIEYKKLKMDFDRWVSTVMEPAHISEARIFSIEAKMKEEESART